MKASLYAIPGIANKLTPDEVIKVSCAALDVEPRLLKENNRKRDIAGKRHVVINMLCTHTKLGLKEIGKMFGGLNHSSVIWSRDNCNEETGTRDLIELRNAVNEQINKNFVTIKNYNSYESVQEQSISAAT